MVDWHRNVNPVREGGEHIPAQPFWVAVIRVIQAIFNILVMSLSANAASYWYLEGYGMAFFTFVWTVLFLLYIYVAPHFLPHLYHFWGHVAAEILTVIWWLVTFALLAHYTRAWSGTYYGGYWKHAIANSTRAATAFAVLNWLLFCVTLGATLFLRTTNIDSHHSTTTDPTAGASKFNFKSLFARKPHTDAEKGTGPTHNGSGQPVELNDRDSQNAGYNSGAGAGHGGFGDGNQQQYPPQAPPPVAAPHYGGQQERY